MQQHGGGSMGKSAHKQPRRFCVSGSWHRVMWKPRVRRLKWAQTLVQDPSHHAQVLTAMFGKLPAEPSATLNSEGELTPEANPWAMRWMGRPGSTAAV